MGVKMGNACDNKKLCENLQLTKEVIQFLTRIPDEDWQDDWNAYYLNRIRVYSFPQLFNSTNCGFGGIGGAAMTYGQIHVLLSDTRQRAAVFVNGRFGYTVENCNQSFFDDMTKYHMRNVHGYNKQYEIKTQV